MYATITPQQSVLPYEGGTIIFQIESDVSGILETSSEQQAGVNHLPLAYMSTHKFEPGITIMEFVVYDRIQIGIDPDIITPADNLCHSIVVEAINPETSLYNIMDQADIIQLAQVIVLESIPAKNLVRKGKGRK